MSDLQARHLNDYEQELFLDTLESFMDYGRNDIHAQAYWDKLDAKWKYRPAIRKANREDLRRHLSDGPYLGRYLISPGTSVVRLGVLDFDDHRGDLDWPAMRAAAMAVAEIAVEYGLKPYPIRSGGGKGIQLIFFWSDDQSAAAVQDVLRTIISAAGYREGAGGVAKDEIEVFPKQCEVAEGEFGSLIALPFGRESVALGPDFEITSRPQLWLTSAPVLQFCDDVPTKDLNEAASYDLTLIEDALNYIDASEYHSWLKTGLALKASFPDGGFDLWDKFSRRSDEKYKGEPATRKQWDRLRPRKGGLTVASIYYWAESAGWKPKHTETQFADFVDVLQSEPSVKPFPIAALPSPFQEFVANKAAAMQVQPDLIAVPLLTVAAVMLGRDWQISPQGRGAGWTEPAILWTACVAESGSMKSPAAKEAIRFLQDLQLKFRNQYNEEITGWLNAKKDGVDPGPKPLMESCYVADTTVESLKLVLSDEHNKNPRGILSHSDELAGWINGLDQYKGKGNDRQIYLSLYDGGFVRIDRKSDGEPVIIPRTGLSINGGLQPAVVPQLFRKGDDGLTPRFQVAWPDLYGEVKLQSVDIDLKALAETAERLNSMRDARPGKSGGLDLDFDYVGESLIFDQEAQIEFDTWCVASRNRRQAGVFGSYVEKQRGLLARLAMIVHGMKHGSGMGSKAVSFGTLKRAMALVSYFESHARKLYGAVDAHPARSGALKIAKWIRDRNRKSFTARDIRQNCWTEFSRERDEGAILASLHYLEAFGWLRIGEKPRTGKGGRPTLVATVNPRALGDQG